MLKKLIVSNLAIVEKAEAEFAPGLNVITGETGAGKSVLMGALELVLGGRADASVVREGAKEAEVEADFGDFTIRRTVTSQGRSRAWIGEESVSVGELKDCGRKLVDIHGPTANQKILEEEFQREALDAYGQIALAEYSSAYAALMALREEEAVLLSSGSEDELDLLRYQVDEIASAELTDDDESIAARHAAAAHLGEIVENANAITEALGGEGSAENVLANIRPCVETVAKHLPSASAWKDALAEITVKIQELSRTIADEVSQLDAGDEDLDALDARLTIINRLKRKYLKGQDVSRGEIAALGEILKAKRQKLDNLEHREERLEEIRGRIAAAEGEVKKRGALVTAKRKAASELLAKAITRELHDLGFLQAKFQVELRPIAPSPSGMDEVVYMFEPNPGESSHPLAAIASSGEIARVMLALKSILAEHTSTGVMVFDEIDANIGGEVGKIVGEKMRGVAKKRQVIAITHLPQSAVYGERHFKVSKRVVNGRTKTMIAEVNGADRVSEIARMLGGEESTTVVKRHAKEMLELSR